MPGHPAGTGTAQEPAIPEPDAEAPSGDWLAPHGGGLRDEPGWPESDAAPEPGARRGASDQGRATGREPDAGAAQLDAAPQRPAAPVRGAGGPEPGARAASVDCPAPSEGGLREERGPSDRAEPGAAQEAGRPREVPQEGAADARHGGEGPPEAADVDDGRFKVVLDNFEGPFDLLLQLISKHKLDVTEVALSRVTDEFMVHIRAMGPDWDLDQTTEFLVVAATLLDLKAARLLPSAEVEDEGDLALLEARDLLFARLLQYRAYKEIAAIFADRLATEGRRYPRTVGLEPHHADLLPEVALRIGPEGFAQLAVKAMRPRPKPQVYVEHIHAPLVSVREQAEVVMGLLRELGEASFGTLTEDAPDTLTVVARFLALLELYRERAVTLDQEEALGTLTVRWNGEEGGGAARPLVTDEFDQEARRPSRSVPAPGPEEREA
ncbi:segregation/condensation protein A [Streptomyces gossypii]|uniref:segregation/condensation protein A n=1 Tax=Streptomyces gossypii TaxID=2883101 RepID=UPI0040578E74